MMIEPGELHRHFKVREVGAGRELWLLNRDARYEPAGDGRYGYQMAPEGDYILVRPVGRHFSAPGILVRLEDAEPVPDGKGMYHPDALDVLRLSLAMTYEGSWRQYADKQKAA